MVKSARRDRATGAADNFRGRVLQATGTLTGRTSRKAKGKGLRARGAFRGKRGRIKKPGVIRGLLGAVGGLLLGILGLLRGIVSGLLSLLRRLF